MEDPYQVNAAIAPITHALNMKRQIIVGEINASTGPNPVAQIQDAINGLLAITADIIVALHELESGEKPKYLSEITNPQIPLGDD